MLLYWNVTRIRKPTDKRKFLASHKLDGPVQIRRIWTTKSLQASILLSLDASWGVLFLVNIRSRCQPSLISYRPPNSTTSSRLGSRSASIWIAAIILYSATQSLPQREDSKREGAFLRPLLCLRTCANPTIAFMNARKTHVNASAPKYQRTSMSAYILPPRHPEQHFIAFCCEAWLSLLGFAHFWHVAFSQIPLHDWTLSRQLSRAMLPNPISMLAFPSYTDRTSVYENDSGSISIMLYKNEDLLRSSALRQMLWSTSFETWDISTFACYETGNWKCVLPNFLSSFVLSCFPHFPLSKLQRHEICNLIAWRCR